MKMGIIKWNVKTALEKTHARTLDGILMFLIVYAYVNF